MRLPKELESKCLELAGLSPEDLPARSKYGNVRTEGQDGTVYDSMREATRAGELRLMLQAGLISDLCEQVTYQIKINGINVCEYVADFVYIEGGRQVVEDAKGMRTATYKLKKKLMLAVLGIAIKET